MTNADVLRVAGEAGSDPRTVRRFVDGHDVRPMIRDRIVAAIKKLGLKQSLPKEKR